MAYIPLAALRKAIIDEEDGNEEIVELNSKSAPLGSVDKNLGDEKSALLLKRRQSIVTKTTSGLVDDVLDVLQQQVPSYHNLC